MSGAGGEEEVGGARGRLLIMASSSLLPNTGLASFLTDNQFGIISPHRGFQKHFLTAMPRLRHNLGLIFGNKRIVISYTYLYK
jgi:hypothetical protein